jgi:syntaxin 1B/2/3
VDQAQDETNLFLEDARNRLQALALQTKSNPGKDARVRKAKQSALAKNVMKSAEQYQKIQSKYRKEYRKRMEREIRIARPDATPQDIERALDSRSGPIFAQEMLSSKVQDQRRVLKEVQGRHEELKRIETSIDELVNIFQEMQLLIEVSQDYF